MNPPSVRELTEAVKKTVANVSSDDPVDIFLLIEGSGLWSVSLDEPTASAGSFCGESWYAPGSDVKAVAKDLIAAVEDDFMERLNLQESC